MTNARNGTEVGQIEPSSKNASRFPIRGLAAIAIVWAIIVASVLTWQAYEYVGPFAVMAEWQFSHWDRMFPLATIALATFLLSLPFLLLIGWRLRRRRQVYGRPGRPAILNRDGLIAKGLLWATVICLIGGIVLGVIGLATGGVADKSTANLAFDDPPPHGAQMVRMRGTLRFDRIGYYRERFVVIGRDLYVAPLVPGSGSTHVRYFAEVEPRREGTPATVETVTGIARRASLPGGLEELYQNEGLAIDRPTYVIFKSRISARWPFLSAAADFAILALLFGLCLGLMRLHLRRLRRDRPATAEAS